MSRLRFDPRTYQFYVKLDQEQSSRAKAAGFRWDPLRRRYYTADPSVAKCVADCGDGYVKRLLADILGVAVVDGRGAASVEAPMQ